MVIRILVFFSLLAASFGGTAQEETPQIAIGAGDVIIIKVYGEPDLTVNTKVGQSGVLRIPLIGDVTVEGKTPQELSAELEAAYDDGYLVSPSVAVEVKMFRPFYIRGAVSRPGAYSFEFGMNVGQAIALAGGLKDRASKSDWLLFRGKNKEQRKVNKDEKLLPGDIIEVRESLF